MAHWSHSHAMNSLATEARRDVSEEDAILDEVLAGNIDRFEALMRRHNRLVYRTARSILKSDLSAEEAAQCAWIAAYRALGTFDRRSRFATWLVRITVNEALRLRREQRRSAEVLDLNQQLPHDRVEKTPEELAIAAQMRRAIEEAIDTLPEAHQVIFMLRDLEGLPTQEIAESLGISPENVRIRLHRARSALRERLFSGYLQDAFGFDGARCDRICHHVLAKLKQV
jgi:RNA polymerase sigma-70 factor (ECF subfamily)